MFFIKPKIVEILQKVYRPILDAEPFVNMTVLVEKAQAYRDASEAEELNINGSTNAVAQPIIHNRRLYRHKCAKCGGINHSARECRGSVKSWTCGKTGHMAMNCMDRWGNLRRSESSLRPRSPTHRR